MTTEPVGFADLHSHLLPGVDDGSKTAEQSVAVLRAMLRDRVTDVCLTPHLSVADLSAGRLNERLNVHNAAYRELKKVAPPVPRCHRGVELMLDSVPADKEAVDSRITISSSRYLLIEFPTSLSGQAIRGLTRAIVERGLVPLIAHAERYPVADIQEVFAWREVGAAIQIDATTLASGKGPRTDRARAILGAGLADIIAADNHGDSRTLGVAARYLVGMGGDLQADYLLRVNPFAVLDDEALEPVPPLEPRHRRLRDFFTFFRQ